MMMMMMMMMLMQTNKLSVGRKCQTRNARVSVQLYSVLRWRHLPLTTF